MHTGGWRPVELEDGSSSSSDPEDQVLCVGFPAHATPSLPQSQAPRLQFAGAMPGTPGALEVDAAIYPYNALVKVASILTIDR